MIRSKAVKGSKLIRSKLKRYLTGSINRPYKSNRDVRSSLIGTRKITRLNSEKIGISLLLQAVLRRSKQVTTRTRKT